MAIHEHSIRDSRPVRYRHRQRCSYTACILACRRSARGMCSMNTSSYNKLMFYCVPPPHLHKFDLIWTTSAQCTPVGPHLHKFDLICSPQAANKLMLYCVPSPHLHKLDLIWTTRPLPPPVGTAWERGYIWTTSAQCIHGNEATSGPHLHNACIHCADVVQM